MRSIGPGLLWGLISLVAAGIGEAQPFVNYRGIVNAASFAPQGLPNGAIARGSIFSIFGRELGPSPGRSAPAIPLTAALGGVSIEVCQGAVCRAALPLFVSPGQINAVMPSNTPLGKVNIRVTVDGVAGNSSPAQVSATGFGIFSINSGGFGPGIVTNFVSQTSQPVNSAQTVARPGQVVTVWGTGLGAALNADNVAPQAGDLPVEVEIWVGGAKVTNKLYSGRSPEFPGLDQVVFEIPASAPAGCYVPVVLRTGRQVVSNSTTIAVGSSATACTDPANPLNSARPGGRTGIAMLYRLAYSSVVPFVGTADFTGDLSTAIFQNEPAGPWHFNRLYSLPPPGTCTTYTAHTAGLTTDLMLSLMSNGPDLGAGDKITTIGPLRSGSADVLPGSKGAYGGPMGTDYGIPAISSLFFGNGANRVSGPGGSDVGPFQVSLTAPPALTWLERSTQSSLTRGAPLQINWAGGDPQGLVLVVGFARAPKLQSTGIFACVERTSQARLTVPDWATAHLPDDPSEPADGVLAVVALSPTATQFNATGLDFGLGVFITGSVRANDFR
ncbi:MAG: hypothetical protein ABIR70_05170 [Bryobacteraceae bacterium]